MTAAVSPPSTPATQRKFVRVIERHANGLVRFEFAVGWPDLSCELALPQAAFDEFCQRHAVEFIDDDAASVDPLSTHAKASMESSRP